MNRSIDQQGENLGMNPTYHVPQFFRYLLFAILFSPQSNQLRQRSISSAI